MLPQIWSRIQIEEPFQDIHEKEIHFPNEIKHNHLPIVEPMKNNF